MRVLLAGVQLVGHYFHHQRSLLVPDVVHGVPESQLGLAMCRWLPQLLCGAGDVLVSKPAAALAVSSSEPSAAQFSAAEPIAAEPAAAQSSSAQPAAAQSAASQPAAFPPSAAFCNVCGADVRRTAVLQQPGGVQRAQFLRISEPTSQLHGVAGERVHHVHLRTRQPEQHKRGAAGRRWRHHSRRR